MTLKIYVVDYGWSGALIAVAESKEKAREIFAAQTHLIWNEEVERKREIQEFEIKPGFVQYTIGDG
jgi:cytochrome b subunit of formate dehydrogenase